MRWLTFTVLAIAAVVAQGTLASRVAWHGLRPDWVLVLVIFYGLHARRDHALVAGWVLGALADLMTLERFGLLSLSYGVTAMAVCSVRELLFTRHPLTHFVTTLVAAVILQLAWLGYRTMLGLPVSGVGLLFGSAVYTALWAPFLQGSLLRLPGLLGFRPGDGYEDRYSRVRRSRV